MMRFLADENFDNTIVRGLFRRNPTLDVVRVQDVGLSGKDDPTVLEWAAQEGRILLTHDVATITRYAYDRVRQDRPMPGVIEISTDAPIRRVIEDVLVLVECSQEGELESMIDELVGSLTSLLPTGLDLEHLRESLLSGVNSRLIGEVTKESYSYRHSIFASSAGVEEVANIILTIVKNANLENKTLGLKLTEVRDVFSKNPKYFINSKTLEYLTQLITSIRNDIAHPSSENGYSKELTAIQSRLSSQLTFAFLQFTTKTLSAFLDQKGQLVDIQILEAPIKDDQTVFYFGFDGDSTGDYLDVAFGQSSEDEVRQRSEAVLKAISELRKLICKETKDYKSILFAEGDNILFKAHYQVSLLNELQRIYRDKTGLTGSIGYGRTLPEVALAMRLSKAKGGDSVMGIALKDSGELDNLGSTAG